MCMRWRWNRNRFYGWTLILFPRHLMMSLQIFPNPKISKLRGLWSRCFGWGILSLYLFSPCLCWQKHWATTHQRVCGHFIHILRLYSNLTCKHFISRGLTGLFHVSLEKILELRLKNDFCFKFWLVFIESLGGCSGVNLWSYSLWVNILPT